jgi:hypothetical protein
MANGRVRVAARGEVREVAPQRLRRRRQRAELLRMAPAHERVPVTLVVALGGVGVRLAFEPRDLVVERLERGARGRSRRLLHTRRQGVLHAADDVPVPALRGRIRTRELVEQSELHGRKLALNVNTVQQERLN